MAPAPLVVVLVAALLSAGSAFGQGVRPVTSDVQVVTPTVPDAVAGLPYRTTLVAAGGRAPYTWGFSTPGFPNTLALNPKTGEIAGRPEGPAEYTFTALVSDSTSPSRTATRFFRLRVAPPLVFTTARIPAFETAVAYRVELRAIGGFPPLKWDVAGGALPAGLKLNPASGLLEGTSSADGDFVFVLRVSDSSNPPQSQSRSFAARITRPLAVDWVRLPRLESSGIHGSARVWNGTAADFDLTFIVVAVNEYGKAFTLGYQKFLLPRGAMSVEIAFGANLPRGSYTVHADAVGEVPPRNAIYRARRQQPGLRLE